MAYYLFNISDRVKEYLDRITKYALDNDEETLRDVYKSLLSSGGFGGMMSDALSNLFITTGIFPADATERTTMFSIGSNITWRTVVNADNSPLFNITEFPGNCSALVLSGIQLPIIALLNKMEIYGPVAEKILHFSKELCRILEYRWLYVSVSDESAKTFLTERGFQVLNSGANYHSGKNNFFLVWENI